MNVIISLSLRISAILNCIWRSIIIISIILVLLLLSIRFFVDTVNFLGTSRQHNNRYLTKANCCTKKCLQSTKNHQYSRFDVVCPWFQQRVSEVKYWIVPFIFPLMKELHTG